MLPAMSTIREEEPFGIALLGNLTGNGAIVDRHAIRLQSSATTTMPWEEVRCADYSRLPVFKSLREVGATDVRSCERTVQAPRASPGSFLDDIVEEIDPGPATTARPAIRPGTPVSNGAEEPPSVD